MLCPSLDSLSRIGGLAITPALLVLLLISPGCRPGAGVPTGIGVVDALEIPMLPMPVDWGAAPGPDGLLVQVFFYRVDQVSQKVATVTVRGTLEFLLFPGRLVGADLTRMEPAYSWRFTGDELRSWAARGAAGWGYAMQLAWGPAAPCSGPCTFVARYDGGDGRWIYSKANSSLTIPAP